MSLTEPRPPYGPLTAAQALHRVTDSMRAELKLTGTIPGHLFDTADLLLGVMIEQMPPDPPTRR